MARMILQLLLVTIFGKWLPCAHIFLFQVCQFVVLFPHFDFWQKSDKKNGNWPFVRRSSNQSDNNGESSDYWTIPEMASFSKNPITPFSTLDCGILSLVPISSLPRMLSVQCLNIPLLSSSLIWMVSDFLMGLIPLNILLMNYFKSRRIFARARHKDYLARRFFCPKCGTSQNRRTKHVKKCSKYSVPAGKAFTPMKVPAGVAETFSLWRSLLLQKIPNTVPVIEIQSRFCWFTPHFFVFPFPFPFAVSFGSSAFVLVLCIIWCVRSG